MSTITVGGVDHPVTERFMAETGTPHPDVLTLPYHELLGQAVALQRLSTARGQPGADLPPADELAPNGTLTVAEQARLAALNNAANVHQAVRFLRGRSHADFSFEGVDQVHGQWLHAGCGCILAEVFDHHLRETADKAVHPHYPRRTCEAHAPLLPDFAAHHAKVKDDDALKAA